MDQSKQERGSVPKALEKAGAGGAAEAQKLAIVRECLVPGASLAGVAMAHQANANMVRKWVVKFRHGGFGKVADIRHGAAAGGGARARCGRRCGAGRHVHRSHWRSKCHGAWRGSTARPIRNC